MSYKLTKELHEAYNAGGFSMLKRQTERSVLFWMCETCRLDSRIVYISEAELATLIGVKRSVIQEAIRALIRYKIIRRNTHGNQYRSSSYEFLSIGASTADQASAADQASVDSDEQARNTNEQARKKSGASTADRAHPNGTNGNPDGSNPYGGGSRYSRDPSARPLRVRADDFEKIENHYAVFSRSDMFKDLSLFLKREVASLDDLQDIEVDAVIEALSQNHRSVFDDAEAKA